MNGSDLFFSLVLALSDGAKCHLFSLKIGVWGRYNRDMERNLRGADKERKGDKMFGFGKRKRRKRAELRCAKRRKKRNFWR